MQIPLIIYWQIWQSNQWWLLRLSLKFNFWDNQIGTEIHEPFSFIGAHFRYWSGFRSHSFDWYTIRKIKSLFSLFPPQKLLALNTLAVSLLSLNIYFLSAKYEQWCYPNIALDCIGLDIGYWLSLPFDRPSISRFGALKVGVFLHLKGYLFSRMKFYYRDREFLCLYDIDHITSF